jgi:hypothetical protein
MPDSDPSSEATLLAENTDLANNTGDGGLPGLGAPTGQCPSNSVSAGCLSNLGGLPR